MGILVIDSRRLYKKALPYFHGVFLASGVDILLIYRDSSDFFDSHVSRIASNCNGSAK